MWLTLLSIAVLISTACADANDEVSLLSDNDQMPSVDFIESLASDNHGERHCPEWEAWQNVTCWWPSMPWASLPHACTYIPKLSKLPAVFQDYVSSKVEERYAGIVADYEQRGSPPKCGHCVRSFQCRLRSSKNATDVDNVDNDDNNDDDNGRRQKHRSFCRYVILSAVQHRMSSF
jgi:hypothetical protein